MRHFEAIALRLRRNRFGWQIIDTAPTSVLA
jgi:hypothetical protein